MTSRLYLAALFKSSLLFFWGLLAKGHCLRCGRLCSKWKRARRWEGTYDNVSFSLHPVAAPDSVWENTRGQTEAVTLKAGRQRLHMRSGGVATRWKSCNTAPFAACFLPFIPRILAGVTGCHRRCGTVLHSHSLPDRCQLLVSSGRDWKMRFLFHVCQESLKAARNTPRWERRCDVLAENTAALWDDACHAPSL